mgnify:CR=1 FL=1
MNETFSGLSFVNLILTFFLFQNVGIHFELLKIIDDFFYVYFYHLILRINHLSNIRWFAEYLFHEWNANFKLPWTTVTQINKV